MTDGPELRVVRDGDEGPPLPKASLVLRVAARIVDLVIGWVLYRSTGPAGVVIALLYLLFADGMLQGQSLGKKLFGVKVVYLPTRSGARHRDSLVRNSPFGLVIILGMMPELGLTAFIGGLAILIAIEGVRCWRDPDGLRLGDVWAQTQVTDGKVTTGAQQRSVPRPQEARAPARFKQVSPRAFDDDRSPTP